ncbi:hypothetical protein Ciccas_009736 [Cichlidogyrus casuarinus]|uniref:Uncharacterized protein n=1 Tax=Cichlidogyrus casuarinus TaxID=1844966 RepID=A0ABD2PYY3_9PLAT
MTWISSGKGYNAAVPVEPTLPEARGGGSAALLIAKAANIGRTGEGPNPVLTHLRLPSMSAASQASTFLHRASSASALDLFDSPPAEAPLIPTPPASKLNVPDIPVSLGGPDGPGSEGLSLADREWQRCMKETKAQAAYRQLRFSSKNMPVDETWFLEKLLRLLISVFVLLGLPFSLLFCLKVSCVSKQQLCLSPLYSSPWT